MSGESVPERLPPPPASALPPPPPAGAPPRQRRSRSFKAAIVALSMAGVGWLIWTYSWIAEQDTGYPDGLACSAHRPTTEAYSSCMRSAERNGAIAWALTLGLALAGLVMLVRCGRGRTERSKSRTLTLLAVVVSASLAVVATVTWIQGAQGGFYEDRVGSTTWNVANVAAILVGFAAGWLLTPRSET
ncbi:MAG: hypothetical protein ACR2NL_05940 [Acidimicrobiia bacterium]